MSLTLALIGFGLRQVIGQVADHYFPSERENLGPEAARAALGGASAAVNPVIGLIEQHYRDHSQTLPAALARANDRAWHALDVALAGEGFCDRVKRLFTSGDDRAFREQVRCFLENSPLPGSATAAGFRQSCLQELHAVSKKGWLSAVNLPPRDVAARAADFRRYSDPAGLAAEAHRAMTVLANNLKPSCPNLARLLAEPLSGGPPLLAAAFAFFFRREVESNTALAQGLFLDNLTQLSEGLDGALVQLEHIDATVDATHAAVLDVRVLVERLQIQGEAGNTEVLAQLSEVLRLLQQQHMQQGEVQPHDSCSIHGEAERRLVKEALARFRALPAARQGQLPALRNSLGKLQLGTGDFAAAQEDFRESARTCTAGAGAAEAHYNAYRAALEQGRWEDALGEIGAAARLDPRRFAPFPLERYRPQRILGAGGFGTAFLCTDSKWEDERVVIKTLHAGNLDREGDSIFQEAKILRRLKHPAIIGVHDFGWADPEGQARPFLVMDYFPGVNLDAHVREHGPLSLEDLLSIAELIAQGLQAVHAQKVLHRDLKPANVLLTREESGWQVKVIDFGLALRRQTIETSLKGNTPAQSILGSSVAGTLLYSPPEQMGQRRDVPVGPYSDVYAFGKTCCYALFQTTEPRKRHWDNVPGELADLLDGCMDQDVPHRLQSFADVLKALAGLAAIRGEAGELCLAREHREALNRSQGKKMADVTALCRKYGIPPDRAEAIRQEVWQEWQKDHPAKKERPAGEIFINTLGMKFAWILPGTFLMGSPPGEEGREPYQGADEKQHGVRLTRGYYLGVYPLTRDQFSEFVKATGYKTEAETSGGAYGWTGKEWKLDPKFNWRNPGFAQEENHPVVCVSWKDAVAFCDWLKEKEGQLYRLPTEAEWEYACRAGTTTPFSFGETISTDQANYDGNFTYGKGKKGKYRQETTPVNLFPANAWGLHDMHGNVWEWCQDWYGEYPRSEQVDPQGPSQGSLRVIRGGCCRIVPQDCRSAIRSGREPGLRLGLLGCRLALVPSGE
jgi:formylglycine-generating enzyme required for sulfatase activity/tetratricopeptide (TPR) repeat protein